MIARHRPPFSVFGALWMMGKKALRPPSLESVERTFADVCGVNEAVWIPSARAGIAYALRAGLERQPADVVCPAFTCSVVHEAVVRGGGSPRVVDSGASTFLMDEDALGVALKGAGAVVLCELFGHRYRLDSVAEQTNAFRIVDMAMGLPLSGQLQRLRERDVAVVSFGLGKSMYAGWGGVALAPSRDLGSAIRAIRDGELVRMGWGQRLRRVGEVLMRSLVHAHGVYGSSRRLIDAWHAAKTSGPGLGKGRALGGEGSWKVAATASNEWRWGSTFFDRSLALGNLEGMHAQAQQRCWQADCYRRQLRDVADVSLPPEDVDPLSHFTIRVPALNRATVRNRLSESGIDTGALFPFPDYLSDREFPIAAHLAREVVNLPLGYGVSRACIERGAAVLARAQ